jgi:AhpD family alkylhydroperoxidase
MEIHKYWYKLHIMTRSMLTAREREIVNLGASIAAGCQPCTKYHVKKCREAGISDALILEVTKNTKQICIQAIEIMTDKVFKTINTGINKEMLTNLGMDGKTEILIGLAASYSMNNTSLFEIYLNHATTHGVNGQQISELIEVTRFIHDKAKAHLDMLCDKKSFASISNENKDCDAGCMC